MDNCTDRTHEILSKYRNDLRFRVVQLKKNAGGAEARNIGMKMAKGEYIAFLDDDDEWHPKKLSNQIEVFQKGMKICIVGCNCQYKTKYGKYRSNFIKNVNLDTMLYRNAMGSFTFCMTKMTYLDGIFIEKDLKACQDWDLWLKLIQKTGLNGFVLPDILAYRDTSHDFLRLTSSLNAANEAHWKFICQSQHLMNSTHKAYRYAKHYSRLNRAAFDFKLYLKSIVYLALSFHKARLYEVFSILSPNWLFGINTRVISTKIGLFLRRL